MAKFAYVVKDKSGRTRRGVMETASHQALIEQLWKQGFVVLSIDEKAKGVSFLVKAGQPGVKPDALVIFARQLATMVDSGIPIVQSLDVLGEQMDDKGLRETLKRMREDIEGGSSLSEAVGRYPKVFSGFFINMVRAGESSGKLDEILDRVASYMEKSVGLQRKVKASLFYPAFVSLLAMGITAFLVIVIVPKFKEIFTALGGELPAPTRLLLGISEFAGRYIALEVVSIMVMIGFFRWYIGTPAGRLWFDKATLGVPVIGNLMNKVIVARFSRTLATLVRSGVPILTALEIVAKTVGNKVVEIAVMAARSGIKEGQNIADPLSASHVFPPMVTRMVAVGEKTGELEKMLGKIADFYENEVDAAITALTSLIEPLVIAVLGLVIGSIVVALFLPVFKISTLVAK